MEFLAILIALALLQVWGSGGPVQRDAWFLEYRRWFGARAGGVTRQLGVVLLPGVVLAMLQAWLGGSPMASPNLPCLCWCCSIRWGVVILVRRLPSI